MGIRRRGNSWQADILVGGKRIRRQFQSAADAEAFLKEGAQADDDSPRQTLGNLYSLVYAARWSAQKSSAMANLGQQIVNHFGSDTDVSDIDAKAMHGMVAELKGKGKSNATVNRWICGVGVMLKHATEIGWIKARPTINSLREPPGRHRYLTKDEEDELVALVGESDKRLGGLVVFLADTGLRLSEAINMEWRDVSQTQVTVHNTKNGLSRSVPLTTRAREVLASLDRDVKRPFSFTDRHHASHAFTRARERSSMRGDLEVVMHTLRHTCASRLVQRGVPVATVSAGLGHKSLGVTMRYAHLRPDHLHDYTHLLERSA